MTSADNAFREKAERVVLKGLSHPNKGFACMLELPPHSKAAQKSDPLGWTRAAMLFVQNLATRHTDNADALPVLANLEEVYAWAGDLSLLSDDHLHVTNETLGVVTVLWEDPFTRIPAGGGEEFVRRKHDERLFVRVRLDVWYSRMAKRLQARLEWNTGNGDPLQMFTDAGLDTLVNLADTTDLLMVGEGYIDNPQSM